MMTTTPFKTGTNGSSLTLLTALLGATLITVAFRGVTHHPRRSRTATRTQDDTISSTSVSSLSFLESARASPLPQLFFCMDEDKQNPTTEKAAERLWMTAGNRSLASLSPFGAAVPSWNSRRFLSTEEMYRSSTGKVTGKYKNIRQSLDYRYHDVYSETRQAFQDRLLDDMLNQAEIVDVTTGKHCRRPAEPWIVFTAGAMGAGKSHTIRSLEQQGHFPLSAFVVVDPDQIRRQLPEFCFFVERCPERAGELTRKEAGFIAEIAIESGLQKGYNILVDGSLSNATWYEEYIPTLRQKNPNLRIAILHVSAPREIVLERAWNRSLVTGRVVPRHLLERTVKIVPQSVARLAPLVDFCAEIDNSGTEVSLVTNNLTWEAFRDVWTQHCFRG